MRTTWWNALRGHAGRLVATGLAVLFAVAFIAGTFAFTDIARRGYDATYARTAVGVDVDVRPAGTAALTTDQVDRIRTVPGIGVLDARRRAPLAVVGRSGQVLTNFGVAGVAVSTDGPAALRAFDLSGRPPGPDEALIDTATAAHEHWIVGDSMSLVDSSGTRHPVRISGLLDQGVSRTDAGRTVVGLPAERIAALTGVTGWTEVVATATDDPSTVVGRVAAALGAGVRVVTGADRRTELADDSTAVAGQFQLILLVFGVVSLVVAAFVIYNTFAILVTQRVRETALLRCVGATRRQVLTLALAEAAAIAVTASVLGVGLGALVGYGLISLLNRFADAGIPTAGVSLGPTTAVIGLTVGLVVTVAAALVPAVRASRTSPMGALRDLPAATPTRRWPVVLRVVVGLLLAAAGTAVTLAGTTDPDPQAGTGAVVAGGLLTFGGLLVWAPLFVGPLVRMIGALPARLTGTPGRLAVANARRNPGRTAATSATLMIGVGLMALFSVVLGSVQRTAELQIAAHYPVDYVMTPVDLGPGAPDTIAPTYAGRLRTLPQLGAVGEIRVAPGRVDGRPADIAAVDPTALGGVVRPELTVGRLADLGPDTVIVSTTHPAPLGSTVSVHIGATTARLRVVGVAVLSVPARGTVDALVAWDRLAGRGDAVVLVRAADGVGPVASRDAVDALAGEFPLVSVDSVADLRTGLHDTVAQLLALFAGLLATSVLIALFGIANTMALSVRERTRESAVLRALGLTRGQLRGTLLLEALLLGLVGAVVGIAFGLVFGRLVVRTAFATIGPVVVVPWAWVAGLAVLAAVAATVAAVLPARHAARASVVATMAER